MELDYTQGFCQAPTIIYRKESNLTMREAATLTYLLSHKEGFKVSYRRISRDLHSDFRTVKKIIQKLNEKGYKELINKVLLNYNTTTLKSSNNNTLKKNTNTSKKLQLFINNKAQSKEKASLKKFTQNKVLEHVIRGAVKLQQGCCNVSNTIILIKNINKELIKKNNFFRIVPKDKRNYPCTPSNELPIFEYEQFIELEYNYINHITTNDSVKNNSIKNKDITIKKGSKLNFTTLTTTLNNSTTPPSEYNLQSPLVVKSHQPSAPRFIKENSNPITTSTSSHMDALFKKVNLKSLETNAEDLPLTLTEDFLNVGLDINEHIDLYHEYQLFRNNKINKKHINSNWLNAWKSWLQHGLTKYKKGAINMNCVHDNQLTNITKPALVEETKEDKLKKYHKLYSEVKKWLFNEYRQLEVQFNNLFNERYKLLEQHPTPRSEDVQRKINSLKEQELNLKRVMDDQKKMYFNKLDCFNSIRPCNGKDITGLQKEYISYCNKLYKEE